MTIRTLISVIVLSALGWAQSFSGAVSGQALVSTGYTGPEVSILNAPISWTHPLADSDVAGTGEGSMHLAGAAAGQFKCWAVWPSGNCKAMGVNAQLASHVAGTPDSLTLSISGSGGNFGGFDLATNNSPSSNFITVNTGVASFVIKKANYDVFSKVTVNGKVLVDDSVVQSDGITLSGPAAVNAANIVPNAPASAPTLSLVPCSGAGCPTHTISMTVSYSYTSPNGESPPPMPTGQCSGAGGVAICTTTISRTSGNLLRVNSPPSTTNANGWYVYVGAGQLSLGLQNPFLPIAIGTNWTEPQGCQLVLRDASTVPITASKNCLGTAGDSGILNYTQQVQLWANTGNDGCVIGGTFGPCSTLYTSANDAGSTAIVEENGPVRAVIRADGSFSNGAHTCPTGAADGAGNETASCYMHYTTRMYFYKGQKYARVVTMLRNADLAPGDNASHPASDFKGYQSYEMRVAFAGAGVNAGAKAYNFAGASANFTAALDGIINHDAMLYQAYNCKFERNDLNTSAYGQYYPPFFTYDASETCPTGGHHFSYVQEGYVVQANGSSTPLDSGSPIQNPTGWADLTDSTGAGIEIGDFYLAAAYGKELKFKSRGSNGYNAVIALDPDQTEPISTATINPQGAMPYYMPWPQYKMDDTFWNFHDAALVSPDNDFNAYQQYLLGRPALSDYNRANFFTEIYPMIDGASFDNYMKNTAGVTGWTLTPAPPLYIRYWGWRGSGEGNQNELGWSKLRNFYERGGNFASNYLYGLFYYRHLASLALPRADFSGGWRGQCTLGAAGAAPHNSICSNLDVMGWPADPGFNGTGDDAGGFKGDFPVGNHSYAYHDWDDDAEHMHYFGIGDACLMLADQTICDAALQAWNDTQTNPNIGKVANCQTGFESNCYLAARSVGQKLSHTARVYTFLSSIDPTAYATDIANAKTIGTGVMNTEMNQTAIQGGFGTTKEGQSPITGLIWGGTYADATSTGDGTNCPQPFPANCGPGVGPYGSRISQSFFSNMVIQGFLDSIEAYGPSPVNPSGTWTNYSQAVDSAYGAGQGALQAGGWIERGRTTSCANGLSFAGNTCNNGTNPIPEACYGGNPCSGTTEWLHMEYYNADKRLYNKHGVSNMNYQMLTAAALINGNQANSYTNQENVSVNTQVAFNEYMRLRGTSNAEDGSAEEDSALGMFLGLTKFTWNNLPLAATPSAHWVDVSMNASSCTGGTCALTWTPPANVVAYRMKTRNDGKAIQEYVALDNVTDPHGPIHNCTNPITGHAAEITPDSLSLPIAATGYANNQYWFGCYVDDPTIKAPWFSSTEVAVSGVPTSFNGTTAPGYNSGATNTFKLKAFVAGAGPAASLTATPSTISTGNSSTLNWFTTDLTSASIDQGIGAISLPSGSTSVSPSVTTVYTLTGTGPDGAPTPATATVTVTGANPNATAALTAIPSSINFGQSSTLQWATTNASSASINHGIGTVTPTAGGSISVSPAITTTYTLSAVGTGSPTATATVTVIQPIPGTPSVIQ